MGPGGLGRWPAEQLGGAEEREGGRRGIGGHLGEGRFLPLFPPPPPPPARRPLGSALAGRLSWPPLSVCVASRMAEVPPGPSSLLPPPAPPASAAAEPRCPFPAGAALACCSEDEEDDEEHEGGGGGRSRAGGEATAAAKGHPCLRCPQPPQEQQQLNGLISPELRHLRAAASLKSKVFNAAEAATTTATPDGGPRATATKGAGVRSGESPPRCLPSHARTALPGPAETAAARNGLAEGAEQEQEEEEDEQVRLLSSSLTAGCSLRSPSSREAEPGEDRTIRYVRYESELQMPDIMRLITKDLSEPYSIYTYRYFIHNWPQLCFLVSGWKERRVNPAERARPCRAGSVRAESGRGPSLPGVVRATRCQVRVLPPRYSVELRKVRSHDLGYLDADVQCSKPVPPRAGVFYPVCIRL